MAVRARVRPATHGEAASRVAEWLDLWGDGLPLEVVLERERRLSAHEWGAARRAVWAASLEGAGTGAGADEAEAVATCEVYTSPVAGVAPDGTPLPAGATAVTIASLYTPPEARRRGLARRLVDGVCAAAAARGAVVAVLYSDIAPSVYEGWGFRAADAAPPRDVTLPAAAASAPGAAVAGVALLDAAGVDAALAGRASLSRPPARGEFVLALEPARVAWAREAEALEAGARGAGAHVGAAGPRGGLALWLANTSHAGELELEVLFFDGGAREGGGAYDDDDTAALAAAAQREAAARGLPRVRLWLGERTARVARVPGAAVEPRDGKLPMARWLAGGEALAWGDVSRGLWW